jgi:type II secretory pathway component PulL
MLGWSPEGLAVTEPERDHFVQQIRDLERRLRRSHLVIVVLAALLLMPLVGGVLLGLAVPTYMARQQAAQARALQAEAEARAVAEEAKRQRDVAEQKRQEAEKARREAGKATGKGKE